jgi:hypothetical protein
LYTVWNIGNSNSPTSKKSQLDSLHQLVYRNIFSTIKHILKSNSKQFHINIWPSTQPTKTCLFSQKSLIELLSDIVHNFISQPFYFLFLFACGHFLWEGKTTIAFHLGWETFWNSYLIHKLNLVNYSILRKKQSWIIDENQKQKKIIQTLILL